MSSKKPTIYDIAKTTGFSPATVSRALNHPEMVSTRTLNAIHKVIGSENFRKRDYRTPGNHLTGSPTGTYLLSIPSPGNPFYGQIIEGAQSAASLHGCTLLICYSMYLERSTQGMSLPADLSQYDGLILMSGFDNLQISHLSEQLPVIECSEYNEEIDTVSCVSIDDRASIRKAVEYLYSTGHRQIAYISCPAQMNYAGRRLKGFRAACEDFSIPTPASCIVILPQTGFAAAHSAALRLLAGTSRPDSVLCSSDIYAIACLKAAFELGIRVPDDLSIIGFDDIPLTTMTQLSVTTIRQPRFQLGYSAFETLYEEVQNPGKRKQKIFLPTELIIRETTGIRRPS